MSEKKLRVRVSRSAGELEIEGSPDDVQTWWDKLWPEISSKSSSPAAPPPSGGGRAIPAQAGNSDIPEVFGEYYSEFRTDISDIDKVLVAAAFSQSKDPERTFSTKGANQLLIDQNIKVSNASESVRRLIQGKRAFVVTDGKFRISAGGLTHLATLKVAD